MVFSFHPKTDIFSDARENAQEIQQPQTFLSFTVLDLSDEMLFCLQFENPRQVLVAPEIAVTCTATSRGFCDVDSCIT